MVQVKEVGDMGKKRALQCPLTRTHTRAHAYDNDNKLFYLRHAQPQASSRPSQICHARYCAADR